jgi:hypothetical protein
VLAYALVYGQKEASRRLGISQQTTKNHLWDLYRRVDAESAMHAAHKLGWLQLPDGLVEPCDRKAPRRVHGPTIENEVMIERIADAVVQYARAMVEQELVKDCDEITIKRVQ